MDPAWPPAMRVIPTQSPGILHRSIPYLDGLRGSLRAGRSVSTPQRPGAHRGALLRRLRHVAVCSPLRSRTTRCPRSMTCLSLSRWFHPSRVPMRVVSSNSPLDSSSRVRRANFA